MTEVKVRCTADAYNRVISLVPRLRGLTLIEPNRGIVDLTFTVDADPKTARRTVVDEVRACFLAPLQVRTTPPS